jgi:hypothetical protein
MNTAWNTWELFLEGVRSEHEELFTLFSCFGLVSLSKSTLTLTAPKGEYARVRLRHDPELRRWFKQLIAERLDQRRVELFDDPPSAAAPSLILVSVQREVGHRQALVTEARESPEISALLKRFSASLAEVVPLSPLSLPPPGKRGLPSFEP